MEGSRTAFGDAPKGLPWVPVVQGWRAAVHSAITCTAEACWCFFPLRETQMTNLEPKVPEMGWEFTGAWELLKTARVESHRQDCMVEKGNDRGSRRLQQPERLLGAAGTKDQIFTGSHLRAD